MATTLKILQERKYFDSGDYAMSKAGKASEGGVTSVGREHPQPENIPHLSSPIGGGGATNGHNPSISSGTGITGATSGSPVKESSFLQRETSADEPSVLSPQTQSPPDTEEKEAATESPTRNVPARWQS